MINHAAARVGLAQLLDEALPDATVQRAGVDAVPEFPSVIIGQPAWDVVDQLPYAFQRSTFPVAVVVNRSSADSVVIDTLESLWPQVVNVLRAAIEADPSLGGICADASVPRAGFGQFSIQGQNYPAQLIFIELNG